MAQLLPSSEGVQGATGKPPGRLRRGEILCETGRYKEGPSLAFHKKPVFCCTNSLMQQGGRRFPKGDRKAPWSPPQRRNLPRNGKKKEKLFPLPSTRNPFLVAPIHFNRVGPRRFPKGDRKALWSPPQRRNLPRNRKRKALSLASHKKSVSRGRFRPPAGGRGTFHHWKVPKGCRGRPKGAWNMAAPGPPVAKLQCTASLAGARPAGFTSVPGRATVAFGAADPSPGSMAPVYPWSVGKGPPRQHPCAAVRAPASVPCKVHTRRGTRLVAGSRPNQMACPIRLLSVERQGDVPGAVQGGSGGIPRPFEGGIGGPGGHRGEVGIPPAPLAGGATLQRKNHFANPQKPIFSFPCGAMLPKTPKNKFSSHTAKESTFRKEKRFLFFQEVFPSGAHTLG